MLRFQGKEALTENIFSDLFFSNIFISLISAQDFGANFHGLAFSKHSNFSSELPFKLERKDFPNRSKTRLRVIFLGPRCLVAAKSTHIERKVSMPQVISKLTSD